ncbi:MAG: anaerobic ribonucleoside-triphosphate reductase activating protein [Desulfobacter sp.]|nr:MAG: anaerobic ribonucleoside-triphosphate reductase activating protein [Desulfobacter sp.]
MYIGGFQKNSLIDFPGAVACLVFTPGCNFTCPYCHNPDLAAGPLTGSGSPAFDQEEIFSFLEKRKGMIQGVAITGGEPTLQKDLGDFITRAREMGYKIKLDSNGTRPQVLEDLFDRGLVDYLAMDIKTDPANYTALLKNKNDLDRILESISLVMEKAPAYEFRTTCVRPFISRDIMERIAAQIQGADLYILQQCSKNVDVLDPDFLKDPGRFFTEKEMTQLKAVIAPHVREARIR